MNARHLIEVKAPAIRGQKFQPSKDLVRFLPLVNFARPALHQPRTQSNVKHEVMREEQNGRYSLSSFLLIRSAAR